MKKLVLILTMFLAACIIIPEENAVGTLDQDYVDYFMDLEEQEQNSICDVGRVYCRGFYPKQVRAVVHHPVGQIVKVTVGPVNNQETHYVTVPWETTFEAYPAERILMQVTFTEVVEADMAFYVDDLPVGSFHMDFRHVETVAPLLTHLVGL